jgi:hypothetical protein
MDRELELLVKGCANNYRRMLQSFRPCKPEGEFLEQNIVTLFAHEFLKKHPKGFSFSEIPFVNSTDNISRSSGWPYRLDLFLYNNEVGYAIEVKGSMGRADFFNAIEDDLQRLTSKELILSLKSMAAARDCNLPKIIKGVVLADCWYKDESDKWESNNMFDENSHIAKLDTMKVVIGEYGHYEYSILAGVVNEPINYGL